MTSPAAFLPGAAVHTPSGAGEIVTQDGGGFYVRMADGCQEWFRADQLTPQPIKEVSVADAVAQAVAAERQRLVDWLDGQMKDLIAIGNREACQWVQAVRGKVRDGV